ncbi:MAG: substrate-binding domain-containing protein [Planctomycetes bacterium]|nr:substrate-binding domain-containing protein [Planctomycetota bacterium]
MGKTVSRVVIVVLAAAIVVVFAIGLARKGGKLRFALVPKSIGHPYWEGVREGMNAAAARLGVEATFWGPPEASVDKQITIVETLISQGYDGIAISPNDPESVKDVVRRAIEAGIAVVTFDSDSPESERLMYIGTDNRQGGRVGAEEMKKLLGAREATEAAGEKLLVQVIGGKPGAWNLNERIEGFKEGVAGTSIELADVLYNQEKAETARQVAETALVARPALKGFFGSNAFAGPGAALAAKGAGKKPGEIRIVAFDTTDDILDLMVEGYIDCTLAQNTGEMGRLAIERLAEFARQHREKKAFDRPLAGKEIMDTGVTVVWPKDVAKYRVKPAGKK